MNGLRIEADKGRLAGLAVGHGITQAVIDTWNAQLDRLPRVLVPVQVDALMVPQTGGNWADCALREPNTGGLAGKRQKLAPDPFTTLGARPAGIYLHWALPAALVHGEPVAPKPGATGPGDVHFPPIPDRWLVVRLYHAPGDALRQVRAWILPVINDAVTPIDLNGWREPGADPHAADYTAVRLGDPTWAAYYDNVVNRLGFYDDMAGVAQASVAYLVAGWYSDGNQDPLARGGFHSLADLKHLMVRLGWELSDEDLKAAMDDALGYLSVVTELGLKLPLGDVPAGSSGRDSRGRLVRPGEMPHWPGQTLLHGSVVGLNWVAGAAIAATLPSARELTVVLGRTSAESMATLISDRLGTPGETRLFTAFQLGVLDQLDEADGRARLDLLLHMSTFRSAGGGEVTEEVQHMPGPQPTGPASDGGRGVVIGGAVGAVVGAGGRRVGPGRDVTIGPIDSRAGVDGDGGWDTAGSREQVARSLPRFFLPQEPVLLVEGSGRSFKHGKGSRFSPDGKLQCRLGVSCVVRLASAGPGGRRTMVTPEDVLHVRLNNGSIPRECEQLLAELALLDPGSAPLAAQKVLVRSQGARVPRPRQVEDQARNFAAEQTVWWHLRDPRFDARILSARSGFEGTLPSPVAVTPAHQPWEPRHLEWEIEYRPSPAGPAAWQLGEVDFTPVNTQTASAVLYRGRTMLTGGGVETLAAAARRALQIATNAGSGGNVAGSKQYNSGLAQALFDQLNSGARPGDLLGDLANLDCVAGAMDGLLALLRDESREHIVTAPGEEYTAPPPVPGPAFHAYMAGFARLTRLRLVDTYGQYVDLIGQGLQAPSRLVLAESLRVQGNAGLAALPPRLTAPARLWLRFQQADDDTQEATATAGPVCGYVVPDHLDGALEFFDARGVAAGQLRPNQDDGPVIIWEPAPGVSATVGAAPDTRRLGRAMVGMANALLSWGVADAGSNGEDALSALLRTIDSTRWSVDPYGHAGDEHLSLLLGHPVVVARAVLRLEIEDPATPPQLAEIAVPVRLGVLAHWQDGLFGYFVNDDYTTFHAAPAALRFARESGPDQGFLQGINAVAGYYDTFVDDLTASASPRSPIEHPYVDGSGIVWVRPGEPVRLTLLLEPQTSLYATCGLLPRKNIGLRREWTIDGLARLAPTFRFGPLLVERKAIRMPVAREIHGSWTWSRRASTTEWSDDPVVNASADGVVLEDPAIATEGWLTLDLEEEIGQ